jgi:2-hydroxy-6-oxonona-2,4-dienedioate hydrolase
MTIWTDLLPLGFTHTYVDAGGVSTRALIAGTGEDVIFLHGTSGHLEAFSRNLAAHVAGGFRCHAIDLLGHGYTEKPDRLYEILDYVDHVLAYLDAQGIEQVHLVGESLGGWIAAYIASDHPNRVLSVQLVAAGGTKANPEVMERIRRSTTEAVMTEDKDLTRQRLHLLMASPERDVSEELVDIRYDIYHAEEFQNNLPNLLSLQDMERRQRNLLTEERLQRIGAPTLIVWGRNNPFGEVPEAEMMHQAIEGSQLELFDDCGHWPQHERSDLYNPLSVKFLQSVAR